MRIVGEWKDYDGEVKSLWDQVNSNVSDETTTVHTPGELSGLLFVVAILH